MKLRSGWGGERPLLDRRAKATKEKIRIIYLVNHKSIPKIEFQQHILYVTKS